MADDAPSSVPSPTPASTPAAPKPAAPANPLAKFPSAVRDAHKHFLATGDVEALDTVVLAVVRDHQPSHLRATSPAVFPDEASLMGDLGFDSLALAEIVFFFEDLYKISITNDELMNISTVGKLREFVRSKVATAVASPAQSTPPASPSA
ncbi:MAG: acyl carrier protein [Rariglobus sp.]